MGSLQRRHGPERESEPPASSTAIDADDVHVTYEDGTEAVRGVSLEVAEGEFFGFLGPNGAGKTTTIKSLVTLLQPTRGSVRIDGHDTSTDPQAVRESVGYMAQETSLDFELTPRENLRVACRRYGVPADERTERIETLLDLVDLQTVADERAETFSGGMQKRLDAATVLVHRPPVVFLDEPTTGLDPEARLRLWDYFEAINDRGTTVFLTTQYLEEADRLCDRLAIIQDGQITHTESPDELKSTVGTDTIALRLADSSEDVYRRARDAVARVDAVADATVERTDDGLRVDADDAHSVTSDLFTELVAADVTVADFEVRSPTLDDVFLSVTGSEDATSDGPTDDHTHGREVVR